MSERFSLKDHLFNRKKITYLAGLIQSAYPAFADKKFIHACVKKFPELELKQRIDWIRQKLEEFLPTNFEVALDILLASLPPELDPSKTDDDFGDFIFAALASYIVEYGCCKEYLDISLHALRECTKRFSTEDAIRYFINAFPEETFKFLYEGATSDNYHVRRLSSEGTRPTLPWSCNIVIDYKQSLPILDMLFSDATRYVTRSVANHMNDISKIDATLVIQKLTEWKKSEKQDSTEMDFIISHSLRTLVKKGDKDALELLGYPSNPKVSIQDFVLKTPSVDIGDDLKFSFDVISKDKQNLMIDYIVHYQLRSGKTNPKVFKIKKGNFKKGETITIHKKQAFKIMTTKKLYPGEHCCEIQINGKSVQKFIFELVV